MASNASALAGTAEVLDLTVGEAAHGGWCVARQDDTGRVVFVRHALPGERVRAEVTQATARFARAEAVDILEPSADRVAPPCPYARPGGCGGCDWQHASLPAQRRLKEAVVRQLLGRLARLDRDVSVHALEPDHAGLGWRTSVSFAVDAGGVAGLRKHRSHDVIEIDRCLIAHATVTEASITDRRWPPGAQVQVQAVPATGESAVLVHASGRIAAAELPDVGADAVAVVGRRGARTPVRGRGYLTQRAAGRDWRVSLGGFWQVHPGAADTLGDAVLAALDPRPGQQALDLYCGAGLFAGLLANAVGAGGSVVGVEHDPAAVRDARHNLRDWPWARVLRGDAAAVLRRSGTGDATMAVLDPPRTGLARAVIAVLCGQSALRRMAYLSCDPATLARDLQLLLDGGWQLGELHGYDAFPMTHHVECLALLTRG